MGHVLDFDDTHMGGVVLHASSPILAAVLARRTRRRTARPPAPVSGADLMLAYAVGFEAGVRCGLTAPGHHKGGWHLTGTLGTFAAAAAGGKLIGLDAPAAYLCDGHCRHPGSRHAAEPRHHVQIVPRRQGGANGVLAALLAERGFDSTQEIIEGRSGFCRIYSDVAAPERLTAALGERWLIESNGHKPYACGVVLHPLIDAVIALRNRDRIEPAAVDEIMLRVHPFVLSITDVAEPRTACNRSSHGVHSAAVALVDGAAGIAQYSDARAGDPVRSRRCAET